MTRTEKCTLLRLLYKSIAEENNFVFLSSRCDQGCECSGYCRKLRAELNWLYGELERIGLSNCTYAAQMLYKQMKRGLDNPENFEPNDLFFVKRKISDEDMEAYAEFLALSEDDAQSSEGIDDTSSVSDDTEASDFNESSQE